MNDVARLFQAFVAPAIFVSATALLVLSVNVRLMGIVSRLRQFVQAKHEALKHERLQEAEGYTTQIHSIERRAEMIRKCFLFSLISLCGTVATCLLLGVGLYWKNAALAAVVIFVTAMICLLIGTVYYIREVTVALSSVRDEVRDTRFMDAATSELQSKQPEL
jgi:ABC-type bacteriocin/lantibiotic exporter with double-glycine peptidase domain